MTQLKKNILILSVLLVLMVILSLDIINPEKTYPIDSAKESPTELKAPDDLKHSDGITQYAEKPTDIVTEDFENSGDINDWNVYTPQGGGANTDNDRLEMYGGIDLAYETITCEYDVDIIPFYDGDLDFDYETVQSGLGEIYLFLGIYDGRWNPNIQIYHGDSGGEQSYNLDLSSYNTLHADFRINFSIYVQYSGDIGYIDDLTINTNEFTWQEMDGDPIDPDTDQTIYAVIAPSFQGLDRTNVTIKYEVNDPSLAGAASFTMTDQTSYFEYDIPESTYTSNEKVYYQIWIHNTGHTIYTHSSVGNFTCLDKTAPVVSDYQNNASYYYNDVNLTCHVKENDLGSGIKNVTMYINVGAPATSGDILILSNNSQSMPSMEGDFMFIIDEKYISAKTGKELHYTIYTEDNDGNFQYTSDRILQSEATILDDIVPYVQFSNEYSGPQGIENDKDLVVSFLAEDAINGSGIFNVSINVKITKKIDPPSSMLDYNYTYNTDNLPIPQNGGIFNFTIPESDFDYGDYIYYYLNATDVQGNSNYTYIHMQTVRSNDTKNPTVVNYSSNGDDAIYNVSRTLTFNVAEPDGASGINNDSLILYFWVGVDGDKKEINKSITKFGGDIDFTILANNFSYGDVVYYQLNVSDEVGNMYSTGNGTFYVGDPYKPLISFIAYNNTSPEYFHDFNISFSIFEDPNGSHISTIELFVKNTTADWSEAVKIFRVNDTTVYDESDWVNLEYLINYTLTYSRYNLDWMLNATDIAGNLRSLTGQINIHDYVNPLIEFNVATATVFEYDEDAQIFYDYLEPIQGSGFNTDGSGLTLYYKIGISNDPNNYTGSITDVVGGSINLFKGTCSFIIPAAILEYNQTIWFWVNGTDLDGNLNGTWEDRKSFYVDDFTAPALNEYTGENGQQVSYHLNKTIKFNATEFSDSSGLKNATIYWRVGLAPTKIVYDGTESIAFTPGEDFVTAYEMTLLRISLNYNYSDVIHFIIDVYDMAGNNGTTASNSFTITDTIDPSFTPISQNTADWTWRANKFLNFTVYDPDYASSSGIQFIVVYYKAGSNPTETDYHGKVSPEEPIELTSKLYSFNITLNNSLFLISKYMYYFIQIRDVEGNELNSTVSSFEMFDQVYVASTVIGPGQGEWLDEEDVEFYINLYFNTNMWILINDELYLHSNSISVFDGSIELEEGDYVVVFKFLDNASIITFTFSVDLDPPDKITDFTFTIYGSELIEISWEEPDGTDSDTVYKLYRSTEKGFSISKDTLLVELDVGDEEYEDDTVEGGVTYYYKIVAEDRVGHVSAVSDELEAFMPVHPLVVAIPLILAIIAGSIVGIVAYRKITAKRRAEIFSQVDLKEIDNKYALDLEEVKTPKGPEWKQIKTKAEPKPIIVEESGFEFKGESALGLSGYWGLNFGNLLNRAVDADLNGDYRSVIRIYTILIRISKKMENRTLTRMLESKKEDLFDFMSKESEII